MELLYSWSREDLNKLQFPIVVEGWDKRLCGRVKRAWLQQFNEAERQKAKRLYDLFYRWYLVKGTPEAHVFKPQTISFIKKLVNFFATI